MKSLQEKLTFWRLLVLIGILLVVGTGIWSIINIEKVNFAVHALTLKARDSGMYSSGDSLKYLSKDSKSALKTLVEKSPNIAAIQVVNIDFKRNERYTTYFVSSNELFLREFADYQKSKSKNTVLFGDDEQANDRLVRIINNNFICDPYSNTIAAKAYPQTGEHVEKVCTMSVPPFIGHFVGYINVHLYNELSKAEEDALKLTVSTIASSIYQRDVIGK